MRIWSIHPKYLDAKGLVALWRETLLAKHVLLGKTKGYKNHPQLNRFKNQNNSVQLLDQYLSIVFEEAKNRDYNFDANKINWDFTFSNLTVTEGQIKYESTHLFTKLKQRDPIKYAEFKIITNIEPHPIFTIIPGNIEDWEKNIN